MSELFEYILIALACPLALLVVEPPESEDAQPKQTDESCLDFDFDKVKEIPKKDGLDNLIIDH